MEFVWPVFLVVVVLWAALLRRQAKALGWIRFARRMVGFAFQSVGGTLAVAGISVLGSAIFGWFENGSWTAATLGQGLNDHHWFYPETGRWAAENLPSLVADIPFGLVLLVVGLAAVVVGAIVMLDLGRQPRLPPAGRQRIQ